MTKNNFYPKLRFISNKAFQYSLKPYSSYLFNNFENYDSLIVLSMYINNKYDFVKQKTTGKVTIKNLFHKKRAFLPK